MTFSSVGCFAIQAAIACSVTGCASAACLSRACAKSRKLPALASPQGAAPTDRAPGENGALGSAVAAQPRRGSIAPGVSLMFCLTAPLALKAEARSRPRVSAQGPPQSCGSSTAYCRSARSISASPRMGERADEGDDFRRLGRRLLAKPQRSEAGDEQPHRLLVGLVDAFTRGDGQGLLCRVRARARVHRHRFMSEMTGLQGCGQDALGVAGLAILMDSRAASSSE